MRKGVLTNTSPKCEGFVTVQWTPYQLHLSKSKSVRGSIYSHCVVTQFPLEVLALDGASPTKRWRRNPQQWELAEKLKKGDI